MRPLEEFLRKDKFEPKYKLKNTFCYPTEYKLLKIRNGKNN